MDPSLPIALLVWACLLPCLYLIGSFFENWLTAEEKLVRGIIYIGIGYGVLAYYVIFTGFFDAMNTYSLTTFFILLLVVRIRKVKEFQEWFSRLFREIFLTGEGKFEFLCQILFWISLAITLLTCFLPETSGDAVAHHLNLPKRYLQSRQIAPIPFDFKSYQSILMNALYTIGLMFKSVPAAKLFHWWSGVFLTSLLILFVNTLTKNKSIAIFSGLMLWLTPTFMLQVSTTYVDIGVTFFLFLAFYLFWRALELKKNICFLLSGAFLGFAANSKYSGLLGLLPFTGFFMLWILKSRFDSKALKAALYFSVGLILCGGFLFIRNWILKGNPVFPIWSSHIGERVASELTRDLLYRLGPFEKNLPDAFFSFFLIPWNFTFIPQYATFSFSLNPTFKVTLGEWMGPFYFLSLPFAAYGYFKDKLARFCCAFIFLYLVGWFFMGQYVRYLLPVLPIYLIASAIGLTRFLKVRKQTRRAFAWGGGFIAFFLFSILLYHFRYQYKPLLGFLNYQTYLEHMERTHPIAEWTNRELPLNAKILSVDEFRLFYFDRETVRWVMLRRFPGYPESEKPKDISQFLKSIGITHVLSAERLTDPALLNKSKDKTKLHLLLSDSELARELTTLDSKNLQDAKYRYSVYELT